MSSVSFEIVLILILILANGVFALAEIAIVSAKKIRLQQLAEKGNDGAKAALELANSPDHFFSTVQVGITLIGILAGAFGGAAISKPLSDSLSQFELLDEYSESLSLGIVVSAITFLSLIIGELVPKRIALNNPEKIASLIAKPMQLLSKIAGPFVKVLSGTTNLVMGLLGIKSENESPVTEEEVRVMIAQGTIAGEFEQVEQELISRIFKLSDRRVSELMTQRSDVLWVDLQDTRESIRNLVLSNSHSSFPVADDSLDKVVGVIRAKDILIRMEQSEDFDVKTLMKKPLFLLETLSAFRALEKLRKAKPQIAVVIDEYGATQGVLTLNDILGSITGDIDGEEVEPQAVRRSDGSWLIDGLMTIRDFKEQFKILELPDEDSGYETVGGFVMHQLGSIPTTGQFFEWNRSRFEVMDMDGRRIDKVLFIPEKK